MQDPVRLSEITELVCLPQVAERWDARTELFREGLAVQSVLVETVTDLVNRLGDSARERKLKATLDAFLRSESIASLARRHAKSREHWSRTYAKLATNLTARALLRNPGRII